MRILIIFFLIIALNCGSGSTYSVSDTNGVRTIHNVRPVFDGDSKISLELVRQIGEYDAEEENLQFNLPSDIDFDGEGNIYILDSGNYRIQKLNPEGNYLATFGRQGQGPGEFETPRRLKIVNNEFLYVIDQSNHNLQIFNLEGVLSETIPFLTRFITGLLKPNGDIYISGSLNSYPGFKNNEPAAVKFDKDGNTVNTFGSVRKYENNSLNFEGNWSSISVDNRNNVYLAFFHQNRIVKISPEGEEILYFNRNRPYAESEAYYFRMMFPETQTGFMVLNRFYFYNAVDGKNRIWVMSNNLDGNYSEVNEDKSNEYNLDIYDSEGILLESFPWEYGENRYLIKIIDDMVYFADSREMAIFEYKIVEH